MNEMIGRVTDAINDAAPDHEIELMDFSILARAAIAAMREPTPAMERAYYAACDENGMVLWKTGYRAMIDAALADETLTAPAKPTRATGA